ncbi:MAG: hypothetical protein JJV93_01620 [Alphaproteobacteria bacterium]|nr:hypothetical protein [Alphaproteobacteria bacterium]
MNIILILIVIWVAVAKGFLLHKIAVILILTQLLSLYFVDIQYILIIDLLLLGLVIFAPSKVQEYHIRSPYNKWVKHPLEKIIVDILSLSLKILPVQQASNLGGWLIVKISPFLKGHKTALKNIELAMPNLKDKNNVVKQSWENLGRSFFETFYLNSINKKFEKYIDVVVDKNTKEFLKQNRPAIFINIHYGSIGIQSIASYNMGLRNCGVVFRFPNNPLMIELNKRTFAGQLKHMHFIPKGQPRDIILWLKHKRPVSITVDVPFAQGQELQFFGKPAMTSTSIIQLAVKYNLPLILVYTRRTSSRKMKFVSTFEPPFFIKKPDNLDNTQSTEFDRSAMQKINDKIEKIIKLHPEQWMWMQQRWKKVK